MADIYLDRDDDGRFKVTVCRGLSKPKIHTFTDRTEAERFANKHLGVRTGMVLSTLDMTPEQLQRQREREAATAERLATSVPPNEPLVKQPGRPRTSITKGNNTP